jgi:hypothetical protein
VSERGKRGSRGQSAGSAKRLLALRPTSERISSAPDTELPPWTAKRTNLDAYITFTLRNPITDRRRPDRDALAHATEVLQVVGRKSQQDVRCTEIVMHSTISAAAFFSPMPLSWL